MRGILNSLSSLVLALSLAILITAVAASTSVAGPLLPACGPAEQDDNGDWYCAHYEYCPPSDTCLLNVINNGGVIERICDCTS